MEKFVESRFTKMVTGYSNALYSYCPEGRFCNGRIQCPSLTPNDEANCTLNEIGVKYHQDWWFTVSIISIFATLYWWLYPPLALHQKLVFFFIPPLLE